MQSLILSPGRTSSQVSWYGGLRMSRKAEHPGPTARISWKLQSFGVRTNGGDVGPKEVTDGFVGMGWRRPDSAIKGKAIQTVGWTELIRNYLCNLPEGEVEGRPYCRWTRNKMWRGSCRRCTWEPRAYRDDRGGEAFFLKCGIPIGIRIRKKFT